MQTVSRTVTRRQRLKDAFSMLTSNGHKKVSDKLYSKSLAANLMAENYQMSYSQESQRRWNDIYQPREKLTFKRRDQLVKDSAILRTVIDKITKEINRNGISMKKVFVKKCMKDHIEPCKNMMHEARENAGLSSIIEDCPLCQYSSTPERTKLHPTGQEECGEEYQTNQVRCTACGFPTREPDIKQKHVMKKLMRKRANIAKQMFSQILHHISIDVEKHDNAFLVTTYVYLYNDESEITPSGKSLVNTYRGNPALIRPVIEYETGGLGSSMYTCILHRKHYENVDIQHLNQGIPRCTEKIEGGGPCDQPLQRVEYVQIDDERGESNLRYCYIADEILHLKKFSPATAMGVSIIDSLYYIILQLIGQEKWIAEYYLKMRMFKGYLDVDKGMAGTDKEVQNMIGGELKKFREDPWYVPVLTRPKGSDPIKFVRIDDSPKEMQYIENRLEARNQVANAYGVSNVWMNDTSSGAGLNNDGMSMVVTNRTVEHGQKVIEEQICIPYAATVQSINVEDVEWYIGYNEHEEQDLMAEKQRKALDIANATAHMELGGDVHVNDEGDYVLSAPMEGQPLQPKNQQQPFMGQSMDGVEGMSRDGLQYERRAASVPLDGSPSLPNAQGSNLRQKSLFGRYDSYSFTYDYADWEWKSNYEFLRFEDIPISNLNIHPDYAIKEEDIENNSPRVRIKTLLYYGMKTNEMSPLIVDSNYNLLDGHHRLYVLNGKNQTTIRVAIVKPTENDTDLDGFELLKIFKFTETQHKRDTGGKFSTQEGKKTDGEEETEEKPDGRKKKPTAENVQEEGKPEQMEEQMELKLEDKYNKRHYTAQQGFRSGNYSNTVMSGGKRQSIGLNMAKDMLGDTYIDTGKIKPPRPGEFANPQHMEDATKAYHDDLFNGYRKNGQSLARKINGDTSDFTQAMEIDSNSDLWFGGSFNDFINILDKKEIGIDKINVTSSQDTALSNNEVAIKFKKGEGELFVDPDPYSEGGYEKEQEAQQFIKMFSVPVQQMQEIWIKPTAMGDAMKERYAQYLRGNFYVMPINSFLS